MTDDAQSGCCGQLHASSRRTVERMLPRSRVLVVLALALSSAVAFAAPTSARPASAASSLSARVAKAIKGSTASHFDYQISVAGLGTISRGATHSSAPASNEKLFTTATILNRLGPTFRYTTPVSATASIAANGTLHGDLVITGSGDPTLTTTDLHGLAKQLRRHGLKHVTGRLIVDDSRYSHTTLARGWKRKFLPDESGPVDAFTVNHNEWRGGASFDRNPSRDNAGLWRKVLKKAHITVRGKTTVRHEAVPLRTLVIHHSESLGAVVAGTLTYSINFDAEMMLREAGAQRSGHGSLATGIAAIRAEGHALGVNPGTMYDGSGLSYDDRETPAVVQDWLSALRDRQPSVYSTIYYGVPVSCTSGTLHTRLCGKNVRGRVRAKTGTLDHVTALSGYTTTLSGQQVTFSFLVSGFKDSHFGKVESRVDKAIAAVVIHG
jgi:serine-type D-Ala-D-Ala carboxypeptidase/endopeptidase (penicillin-binding protein 4)